MHVDTLSSTLQAAAKAGAVANPGERLRSIAAHALGPTTLPPTRSVELHHIRGVSNPKALGGEDVDRVIFPPEWLYVLDVGLPARAGILLHMNVVGLGDPSFPDFSTYSLRSIVGGEARHLVYPAIAGDLLVAVKPGTPSDLVKTEFAAYASSIANISADLYELKVTPFHEPALARDIEAKFSFVRYAQTNFVLRRVDFAPGWLVDRVL